MKDNQFKPTFIRHDGDVSTLTIKDGHLLVLVDEDDYLTFKGGLVFPKTFDGVDFTEHNPEVSGRHGKVVVSRTAIPKDSTVFFSYWSARNADRIVSGDRMYYLIPHLWCYLWHDGEIHLVNDYLLAETYEEEVSSLLLAPQKDGWYARVLHVGEGTVNIDIEPNDVVLYRMSLEVKLEGMKQFFDRDYRVISRKFCILKVETDG